MYTPGEISSQLWASTRFEINEANDEEVFYSIHSHPNYRDDQHAAFGLAVPSLYDLKYKYFSRAYTDIVLSYANIDFNNMEQYKLVGFYSADGLVCTFNYSSLKVLSKKIYGY